MNPDVIAPVVSDGVTVAWMFMCPACKCGHSFAVVHERTSGARGPVWDFNGDKVKATFSPSLLCTWNHPPDETPKRICHSFVRNGMIEFCGDCTHALAGKTVALAPVELALEDGSLYNSPET